MSVLSTLTDFSGPHLLEDDPFVPDQLTLPATATHSYIKNSTEILTPTHMPYVSVCQLYGDGRVPVKLTMYACNFFEIHNC